MLRRRQIAVFLSCFLSVLWGSTSFAAVRGPVKALIRFPSVHGSTVVFEAGGALWKTSIKGGVAERLTADPGYDFHSLISPNGKQIAFTGWYRGNTDVYVMPLDGGPVKQLTWRSVNYIDAQGVGTSADNIVIGWTPDSKDVVFLSRRQSFNEQVLRAFKVPVSGGLPVALPMPWSGPLSFNRAGTAVIYNKMARILRQFHRKDYVGGAAGKLFTYDFKTGASREVVSWKGENTWPMWAGHRLYFASDKGPHGVLNLWQKNLLTGARKQLTHFRRYDIDWPSLGNTGIVLSDVGRLYFYSFKTRTIHEIPVRVALDGAHTLPYSFNAAHSITGASFAPNGRAGIFSARGALFLVPVGDSATRRMRSPAGSNYKDPSWAPNGSWVAYIDDTGRESRLAIRPVNRGARTEYFTPNAELTYTGPLVWSPNSRHLTYTTSNDELWILDLKDGHSKEITRDPQAIVHGFSDATFSPDSRWLAFSAHLSNFMRALFIYDTRSGKLHQVSRGRFSDKEPYFSRNGKYLFFTSARLVNPVASSYGTEAAGADPDGLYVVTLRAGTPSLFAPRTPWEHSRLEDIKTCDKASRRATALAKTVQIDFPGLIERALPVPVNPATISKVAEASGVLYYETKPLEALGGSLPNDGSELHAYCLSARMGHVIAKGLTGKFMLSSSGLRLFYPKDSNWYIQHASFKTTGLRKPLSLDYMRMQIVPRPEWREVFWEAWRNVRDYFVNPLLIKQRWSALGHRYAKLLPRVQDPQDLNYLIDNLMGSLDESHMYFYGRHFATQEKTNPTASLGADFALDRKSGYYFLKHIYRGDNTLPSGYAPLAQPGLNVKVGDYVLAINGEPLRAPINPFERLQDALGQPVALTLAHRVGGKAWTIEVKPITSSRNIRLFAWVRHNRKEVSALSGGKVGYVYLNDMGSRGLREFVREFYRQINKPALIIDTRWNLGGYVNTLLFNELLSKPVSAWVFRSGEHYAAPQSAYTGKLALVVNHGTASDGDIFASRFKQYKLGPVIGSRTWGGVRGYFKPFTLLNGSHQIISEQAMYRDSKWVVEGYGVKPTVEAHFSPGRFAKNGTDTQLQAAVNVLLGELRAAPARSDAPPAWLPAFPSKASIR